jgi:hypothetical protein
MISDAGRILNYAEGRNTVGMSEVICKPTSVCWIYVSEGEWFHVTACKMNYTNQEYADMHLILGEVRGNSDEAQRLCVEGFPNRPIHSRPRFLPWISGSGEQEHSKET